MGRHRRPVAVDEALRPASQVDGPADPVWDGEIVENPPAALDPDLDVSPTPPPWFRA